MGDYCRDCDKVEATTIAAAPEGFVLYLCDACYAARVASTDHYRALEMARDSVILAARALVRSGYDGPFMGSEVEPLFKAVRLLEAQLDGSCSLQSGGADP